MVRVIFELTDISKGDGATCFLLGSHKANFPIHSNHLSLEDGQQSEFLHSYDCPAGSAIFLPKICATPDLPGKGIHHVLQF